MTQRLDEQAGYWTETGIHKHIEQQRLLEEKKAKEKAEEELRRQREPTPDLESFSITATDTIKASATTPSKIITAIMRTSSTVTISHNQQSSPSLRKNCTNNVTKHDLNHHNSHSHSNNSSSGTNSNSLPYATTTNKKYSSTSNSSRTGAGSSSTGKNQTTNGGGPKSLKRLVKNKQSGNYLLIHAYFIRLFDYLMNNLQKKVALPFFSLFSFLSHL